MVTIHYSHYFDKGVYSASELANKTTFNVANMGSMGLLGFLERELGLTGDYPDLTDRVNRYSVALRKNLNEDPNAFYSKAFETDEMGVAKDLIRWRDDLVWLGWQILKLEEQPKRLKTLATVEQLFADRFFHFGVADRWNAVVESLPEEASALNCMLFVYDELDLMHPFFKKLFIRMAECVEFRNINENITVDCSNLGMVKNLLLGKEQESNKFKPVNEDNSFSILYLKDNHFAADFLSNQIKQGFNPVVINDENKILDYYIMANGLPAAGSMLNNSNPLIIQLFKLITVGLVNPINVYNLLSFLQSPYSPIPKKLSSRLARQLIEKPGIDGLQWKETVDRYFEELKETEPDENKRKKKRDEIALYLTFDFEPTVDIKRLKNVYSSLKGWADTHSLPEILEHSEEERDQFAYLSKLANALLKKIEGKVDSIDASELLKLTESIYEPASFSNELIQAGSIDSFHSPAELLDNPPIVWWQDCYNTVIKAEHHIFLYADEIEFLKNNGIGLYEPSNQIKMVYQKAKRGILAAQKQCVLVVVEKHYGDETTVHPIMSEINAYFENINNVTLTSDKIELLTHLPMQVQHTNQITLPEAKMRWKINNPDKLLKRETESASSIEKLIQHPFEWVINYQAKMANGNSFTLPEIFILKGKIAHAATESILKQRNSETQFQLTDELITNHIDKKIREEGLIFMSPEMRFEYEELLRKYKIAIKSLISIITENKLKVIDCEYHATKEIQGLGCVAGFLDLVLQDSNGQQVIFDLKWTKNNKKYETKLAEGKAIQLAIYYALLGNKPRTGYFMFDNGKLYTQHNFTGEKIILVKTPAEFSESGVLAKTNNSVEYRWEELADGDIEIGDNAKVSDLNYYNETEEKSLIPLEIDTVKKIKYGDAYSGLELFKGDIQ